MESKDKPLVIASVIVASGIALSWQGFTEMPPASVSRYPNMEINFGVYCLSVSEQSCAIKGLLSDFRKKCEAVTNDPVSDDLVSVVEKLNEHLKTIGLAVECSVLASQNSGADYQPIIKKTG